MPGRSRTLIAAFLVLVSTAGLPAAEFAGAWTWKSDDPGKGGFSGLEISRNGRDFVAISDRAGILKGTFERVRGRITGLSVTRVQPLKGRGGRQLKGEYGDSEGLAITPDGRLFVSFEGKHRVLGYPAFGSVAEPLPRHPDFAGLQGNSSLEGLAIDRSGALYTMPERSGRLTRPFPVWRFANGKWRRAFTIPRRGVPLPVGLDFDDRGRLYLLERHFAGITGFSTRVRRFTLSGDRIIREEILLETGVGRHDNLEGIAVWRDEDRRQRITMISDDNFRFFQRTEFVEYIVPD